MDDKLVDVLCSRLDALETSAKSHQQGATRQELLLSDARAANKFSNRLWVIGAMAIAGVFGISTWVTIPGAIDDLVASRAIDKATERVDEAMATLGKIGSIGSLPIGSIVAWYHASPPPGGVWRICDGGVVVRKECPALATLLGIPEGNDGFNLPDLTGRFLRGAIKVDSDGVATWEEVGASSEGSWGAHEHELTFRYGNVDGSPDNLGAPDGEQHRQSDTYVLIPNSNHGGQKSGDTDFVSDGVVEGEFPSPPNAIIHWIIKVL